VEGLYLQLSAYCDSTPWFFILKSDGEVSANSILQYRALATAIRREFIESVSTPQFGGAAQQFDGRAKDSTNF
jgi:hypothetical protein